MIDEDIAVELLIGLVDVEVELASELLNVMVGLE